MSAISKVKDLLQERIVGPIKRQCPEHVPMQHYLQLIFNTNTRIISRYHASNGAVMVPGLYCVNGCIPRRGIGDEYRLVRSQRGILVRHDETLPNVYHVDNRGHIFLLTRKQWKEFKKLVKVSPWSEEL